MGWTNADNKFGLSKYIVGPVLGDGVNYTSIQTAINDINASTQIGTIYVRPGTYNESPAIPGGNATQLVAAAGNAVDSGIVVIVGNVSIGAGSGVSFTNFFIEGNASNTSGGTLAADGCVFFATAGDALTSTGGSGLDLTNCILQVVGGGNALTVDAGAAQLITCQALGPVAIGSAGTPLFDNCNITAQVTIAAGGGSGRFGLCAIIGGANSSIDIGAGSNASVSHCNIDSSAGSGNPITGTGTLFYADVIFPGTATVIDPGLTVTILNWQPFGTAAAAFPAAPVTCPRGTMAADSTFFQVTDGQFTYGGSVGHSPIYELDGDSGSAVPLGPFGVQVNILGKAGCTTEAGVSATNNVDIYAVKYTDIIASGTAVSDFGHFITTTVTTTLPAAPDQGTIVSFILTNAGAVQTIQAPGAAKIRIGNQISSAGGTATSTAIGDHLRLVYRLAPTDTWFSEEVVGNWTLS